MYNHMGSSSDEMSKELHLVEDKKMSDVRKTSIVAYNDNVIRLEQKKMLNEDVESLRELKKKKKWGIDQSGRYVAPELWNSKKNRNPFIMSNSELRLDNVKEVVCSESNRTIKSFTTLIAVRYNGGIIMGSDRLMSTNENGRSVVYMDDATKIQKLYDHIYCSSSGDTCSIHRLIGMVQGELLDRYGTDYKGDVEEFAELLDSARKRHNLLDSCFIIGGRDISKKAHIFRVPPALPSCPNMDNYICAGSGGKYSLSYISQKWSINMSEEQALKLVQSAVAIGINADVASGGNMHILAIRDFLPETLFIKTAPAILTEEVAFEISINSVSGAVNLIESLLGSGILEIDVCTCDQKGLPINTTRVVIRGQSPDDIARLLHTYAETENKLISIKAFDDEAMAAYTIDFDKAVTVKQTMCDEATTKFNAMCEEIAAKFNGQANESEYATAKLIYDGENGHAQAVYNHSINIAADTKEWKRRVYWFYDVTNFFQKYRESQRVRQAVRMGNL